MMGVYIDTNGAAAIRPPRRVFDHGGRPDGLGVAPLVIAAVSAAPQIASILLGIFGGPSRAHLARKEFAAWAAPRIGQITAGTVDEATLRGWLQESKAVAATLLTTKKKAGKRWPKFEADVQKFQSAAQSRLAQMTATAGIPGASALTSILPAGGGSLLLPIAIGGGLLYAATR